MCIYCDKRGKTWSGDSPVCGFDDNQLFNKGNWNCALLNKLRDLGDVNNFVNHNIYDKLYVIPLTEYSEHLGYVDFKKMDEDGLSLNDVEDLNKYINSYKTLHEVDDVNYAFVLLQVYKNRGRVDSAHVYCDDKVFPLTRNIAERVLFELTLKEHDL